MTSLSFGEWNEAISRYCFHVGNAGRPIRFAIDPIILQRAAAEGPKPHHFSSPEEAAADFQAAVISRIRFGGWDFGASGSGLMRYGLAKLALQVLAVFYIEADEEGTGSYWRTLNGMFGLDGQGMPAGLTGDLHQSAWRALARWANIQNEGRFGVLGKPGTSDSKRKHVRLPLHHGLLRLEDFKTLPRFFKSVSLASGEEVDAEELENDLRWRADDAAIFPRTHARRVLQDPERLPLAAVQVANALAQWDGGGSLDLRAERRTVRLWFSISRRDAARVRVGLVERKRGNDPTEVPGVELGDVLTREGAQGLRAPIRYRPIRGDFVLAVRSLLDGRYIEAGRFYAGDQILIARPRRPGDRDFEQRLRGIAASGEVQVIHPDPSMGWPGWVVFQLRVRENVNESDLKPLGLAKCLKPAGPRLIVSGGLRFRRAWLEGAGPTLSVLGGESEKVIVDGEEYDTVENRLDPEHCPALNTIGTYKAWLPGHRGGLVRFRVERPKRARFKTRLVQAGWEWKPHPAWPASLQNKGETDRGRVRGPAIEGEWPPIPPPRPAHAPAAQAALQLATALRRPNPSSRPETIDLAIANSSHPNLLVRQLARALTATGGRRNV